MLGGCDGGGSFECVPGKPVLHDVSFAVEPGRTLALVGNKGAVKSTVKGAVKSTVASLVPRFYDPKERRIVLDGEDLRTMRLSAARRNVGVIL